jgi:CTP synthase
MDGKMEACKFCREKKKPFLSICLGFEAAVAEFSWYVW